MVEQTWGKDWHEGSANIICSPISCCRSKYGRYGYSFWLYKHIIIPEVDPELILSLVEKEKIELALLVPAIILFLLNHPNVK